MAVNLPNAPTTAPSEGGDQRTPEAQAALDTAAAAQASRVELGQSIEAGQGQTAATREAQRELRQEIQNGAKPSDKPQADGVDEDDDEEDDSSSTDTETSETSDENSGWLPKEWTLTSIGAFLSAKFSDISKWFGDAFEGLRKMLPKWVPGSTKDKPPAPEKPAAQVENSVPSLEAPGLTVKSWEEVLQISDLGARVVQAALLAYSTNMDCLTDDGNHCSGWCDSVFEKAGLDLYDGKSRFYCDGYEGWDRRGPSKDFNGRLQPGDSIIRYNGNASTGNHQEIILSASNPDSSGNYTLTTLGQLEAKGTTGRREKQTLTVKAKDIRVVIRPGSTEPWDGSAETPLDEPDAEDEPAEVAEEQNFDENMADLMAEFGLEDSGDAKTNYFNVAVELAKEVEQKYGVPYKVCVAQACLESGWGTSGLTRSALNCFGYKTGSQYSGDYVTRKTKEVVNGQTITINAKFRAYSSLRESFMDYGALLSERSRYAEAFNYTNDPERFLTEVIKGGYATDPNYVSKAKALMAGRGMPFDPEVS